MDKFVIPTQTIPIGIPRGRVMAFAGLDIEGSLRRHGVSALEFDNQGVYLGSVTRSGCLMVHDFESLYCQSKLISPWVNEDETKHLLHISTCRQLYSVRWNPSIQDEVACTSMKSSEIFIFDIGYISSKPIEVLKKKPCVTIHGVGIHKGLSDVAFSSSDDSRIFASDTYGSINIWDRRSGSFPSVELKNNSQTAINSIELNIEDQIYVVGSSTDKGLYLLDFIPIQVLRAIEDLSKSSTYNGFVPLSEDVAVCAAHPCNGFIVAGTKQSSLLVVSQRKKGWQGEEDLGSKDKISEE